MRIRKRSVPLPLSLITPTATLPILHSDPPLKPDHHHHHETKELHPNVDDDFSLQNKTHLYHQQSDDQLPLNTPKLLEEDQAPSGSSNLQLKIIREKNGWICSDGDQRRNNDKGDDDDEYWCMNPNQKHMKKKKKALQGQVLEEDEDENEEEIKGYSGEDKKNESKRTSNINNLISTTTARRTPRSVLLGGAEVVSGFGVGSSDHHDIHHHQTQTVGTSSWDWGEGVRTFSVKKRRGSFGIKKQVGADEVHDQAMAMAPEKDKNKMKIRKTKTRTTTTTKKKWVHEKDQEQGSINIEKSKKREQNDHGGVMEGSRCSRINGRGWRCFQQTLVGYSLCEHHLGKGRLRSMSSVRRRSKAVANSSTNKPETIICKDGENHSLSKEAAQVEDNGDHEDHEEKTKKEIKLPMSNQTMINKNKRTKKKKIGMVKARSISSLLGQTQQYGTSSCHTS